MYGDFSVVHISPKQQGALSLRKDLPVHERMATDKMKYVIWQVGGRVDASCSELICDALKRNGKRGKVTFQQHIN